MAEDLTASEENLDRPQEINATSDDKPSDTAPSDTGPEATSPPPPLPPRRGIRDRERDSRERRDDRDSDRPPRRDYYDRNRSPPPPRERDFHKRGRLSPSPPPPSYRDRRGGGPYSPPPRRSPPIPPYKRRRDDGYDGRRGSPRGGHGRGDRRFGYDYPGGYERENGGRPGYPDERPHGRYMGRGSGGYQDWDSGRSGFADAFNLRGAQREGMMSYKQFIQELEDDILPAEAERRYQEYKTEYISTQKTNFFNAHKDEEWLKDKYHPTNLLAVIERRNELAQKLAKDFQADLQSGNLDLGPGFNPSSLNKAEQSSDPKSDDEENAGGKRKQPGRSGAKDSDHSSAPKAHPVCSEPKRILIDIEQALALVQKLDTEKGIEDNVLFRAENDRMSRDKSHGSSSGPVVIIRGLTTVKGLEGTELLDTLLTYLWRIHGVDYYGLVESNEAKGLRHVRVEVKNSDAIANANDWENKLNSHWQERLKGSDPLEIMTGKEKIDAAANEALNPHVRKIRDEKYGWKFGCGAKGCTKLFHAAEFVHKHLKLKHPELAVELTTKVREELYLQNYMKDENAPGGKPVMQPSLKEKLLRRRPGPDNNNRMNNERGDRNYRANGNEHFDRPENSQSGDFANQDGASGNNADDPMYDSFGGQGIPLTYASDVPPPVLMPVPGAGPMGPFVPAPPEVAMQMMRDRGGGPSPFEGGRNGPSPIIALPPRHRQDPRSLRSYNDLDAPDDEVTVIDYRSL
ncbi:hypothetical protein MIMGU_mgv1a001908mg [Erythranthe guttata]|uniref:C2H2-type domain-containing protein n=1 Tax=Erythranthe guttata TaxID=4155 RepID=A0A022RAR2_ERYGU|nr:PREDICTED: serrate RNA effector molecule-like [Erythranthe guttata]EYU35995.1 hypothetical protein MIMGU_mgv1a001908mg [Erythranthe guttata]|eukprot:XP_012838478.1 PREDICTED: serrate RNA effector molecule-like [Erythranthe guttata]